MELKRLLSDDRGVSPVIGVILMVAITVILAAVIGTFVLGLGSQVGNQAPQATFNYQYNSWSSATDQGLNITDQGGQQIDTSTLTVSVGDKQIYANGKANSSATSFKASGWTGNHLSAGDTLSAWSNSSGSAPFGNGKKVNVVWKSSGGSSSIISTSTTPS